MPEIDVIQLKIEGEELSNQACDILKQICIAIKRLPLLAQPSVLP